jgi:hypothetical protein
MDKEMEDHENYHQWKVIKKSDIPEGTKLIDMVWLMQCKRRINTGKVYKWKSRLNIHGGQQGCGGNYWDTYSPVTNWQSLLIFFITSLIK